MSPPSEGDRAERPHAEEAERMRPRPAPHPSQRPTLVHRIRVSAPPERVWQAITDPRFTEQYLFGLAVRSDWQVGTRVVFETPSGETHLEGRITEIDRPVRLRFSARLLRDPETARDLPSRITWEVAPVPGGCEVTVVHDEFDGETYTYRRVKNGWPLALLGLRELLETGRALEAQSRWPPTVERPRR